MLSRLGKPEGMYYLDHQSVDAQNGIIVDVAMIPGNVTDATPYLDRIAYMREHNCLPIETVGVVSAYDISLVHQETRDKNIRVMTPVNDQEHYYKAEFTREAFDYDARKDVFTCPNGVQLSLRCLHRFENNVTRE